VGADLQTVLAVFRRAELGYPADQCDLFDDLAERDDCLFGLVNSRRASVAACPYEIVAGSDDAESERAADAFREVWNALPTDSVIINHAHGPNFYGWSATELEWAYRPEERRFDVVGAWNVPSRLFRIASEYDRGAGGAVPEELLVRVGLYEHQVGRLIPHKWIVTRRVDTERVARTALMRRSAWYSVLKSRGFAEWFAWVHRYGTPLMDITVPDFSKADEVLSAFRLAQAYTTDEKAIVRPKNTVEVKFHDPAAAARTASSDVHGRFVTAANTAMTRIWNGSTLATEAGDTGTYAQAKVHSDVRFAAIAEDATRIPRSIGRQLIKPWMAINKLPGAAPRLVIHLTKVADPGVAVELAVKLDTIGVKADLGQLQEITGLRLTRAEPQEKAS
jgi:phage gp29-like protein